MTAMLNGSATFDLDAASAAAARDGSAEPMRFSFHGQDFTLPAQTEWPLGVSTQFATADLVGAMTTLLGDQAPAFLALNPTVGHIKLLVDHLAAWSGLGSLGNSPPPQRPASTPM